MQEKENDGEKPFDVLFLVQRAILIAGSTVSLTKLLQEQQVECLGLLNTLLKEWMANPPNTSTSTKTST